MIEIILLAVAIVSFGWATLSETLWIALIGAVIFMAGTWLFGDPTVLEWMFNPITLVAYLTLWLAVGALWSLWKWRSWVRSEKVQDALRSALHRYKLSDDTADFFKDSIHFPRDAKASCHVDKIICWITLWPFSMIAYFFEDFLMDVGRWIYNRLGAVYQSITLSAIPDEGEE